MSENDLAVMSARGANVLPDSTNTNGYFDMVLAKDYSNLAKEKLHEIMEQETSGGSGRIRFASVYDPLDDTSREARTYYFEGASAEVNVIAGDGRTVAEANSVWDQFRYGYHTSESVKNIFFNTFGLDPDDDSPVPESIIRIIKNQKAGSDIFKNYSQTEKGAIDEMSLILGQDFINNTQAKYVSSPYGPMPVRDSSGKIMSASADIKEAIEYVRKHLIDAPLDERRIDKLF